MKETLYPAVQVQKGLTDQNKTGIVQVVGNYR